MEDIKIIDLFWKREEKAIRETQRRYEPYCRSIAQRMLKNHQDVQECLNDTWLGALERHTASPAQLSAHFFGKNHPKPSFETAGKVRCSKTGQRGSFIGVGRAGAVFGCTGKGGAAGGRSNSSPTIGGGAGGISAQSAWPGQNFVSAPVLVFLFHPRDRKTGRNQ